jgi:Cof subfamily protein (haloacid dehalogenase superfamily)
MLFAFDLDATIVTRDFQLPASIVKTINAIRDAGHPITVITGRSEASASAFLSQLDVKDYYSVNHGATIHGRNGDILVKIEVEADLVAYMLDNYHDEETECYFYEGNRIFVADPSDARWAWASTSDHELISHDNYLHHHVDKISLINAQRSSQIYQELLSHFPDLSHYHWEGFGLEVTGKGGTKGEALKYLAQHFGVKQADTVAFGDGVNDISMLEWAGYAVGVGKAAHPRIKELADEMIAAPEEGGVAHWLTEHYL